MNHLMLDIETLGEKSSSVITQIAAVEFDINTGNTGRSFNMFIDIQSCLDAGLKVTGSTIKWWFDQSKEAQQAYTKSEKVPLSTALQHFSFFLQSKNVNVWGNSARFDCGILNDAYNALDLQYPIKHYNELDVRTIVFLNPSIKKETEFVGVKHNAIDDCKHQINYLVKTLNNIRK